MLRFTVPLCHTDISEDWVGGFVLLSNIKYATKETVIYDKVKGFFVRNVSCLFFNIYACWEAST